MCHFLTVKVKEYRQRCPTLGRELGYPDSRCHAIRMNTTLEIQELKELETNQEEADTRMLLHAPHASKTWTNIVIKSPDTDVFVLALSFCSRFNNGEV